MLTTKAMPRMASRGRLQRPALMLLAVAAGVLWAGALLQPTTAKALSTQIWCPSSYANFICEESSFAYHSYRNVRASIPAADGPVTSLCAVAKTAAGNWRSSSGCSSPANSHRSCIVSDTPYSRPLGYWTGSGPTLTTMQVAAATLSDTIGVCGF